jgi:hypothetical protein
VIAAEFQRIGPSSAAALSEAAGKIQSAGLGGLGGLGTDIAKALLLAKRGQIDPVLDLYAPNFSEKFAESGDAAREALSVALVQIQSDLSKGISADEAIHRLVAATGAVELPKAAQDLMAMAAAATDPQAKLELLLQVLGTIGSTNATATVSAQTAQAEVNLARVKAILDSIRSKSIRLNVTTIRASRGDAVSGGQVTGHRGGLGANLPKLHSGGFGPMEMMALIRRDEFVMSPGATRFWGADTLNAMNAKAMPQAAIPALPPSVRPVGGDGGSADVVRAIGALGDRIARMETVVKINAREVGRGVLADARSR